MLLYRISECRWTGTGCVTTSLGNTIVYSGRNDNDHREGVAIMMSIEVKKSMKEWTPKSERRMVARFKFRYTTLSKVVRSNEGREKTMEKNGCGKMNENGETLADICGLNDLVTGAPSLNT